MEVRTKVVQHSNVEQKLTKNQSLVLKSLFEAQGPMSAYSILDDLRAYGFKAPLQVYRALEKLTELGVVHRLESLNSFIACNVDSCGNGGATAFVICDQCESIQEVSDNSVSNFLGKLANKADVKPTKSSIELHGICNDCEKN